MIKVGSQIVVSSRVEHHEGNEQQSMCSFSPNRDGPQWSRAIESNGGIRHWPRRHAADRAPQS